MAKSNLILHCGAKSVTPEELAEYKAPPPSGRWFPLSHGRVLSVVSETLRETGYAIERQQLGVMRGDGSRFFGTLDLKSPVSDGVGLAVGIRNSVDQSYAELNVMPDWAEALRSSPGNSAWRSA